MCFELGGEPRLDEKVRGRALRNGSQVAKLLGLGREKTTEIGKVASSPDRSFESRRCTLKALTSAFSIAALFAALVVLPGCGGGDEAVPPADDAAATEPMPGDDLMLEDTGEAGAMEGPAGDLEGLDAPEAEAPAESETP